MDFSTLIRPLPSEATFADPGFNVWCGSVIKGLDGRYHLFYSRWPTELGHYAWVTHSEVARAVSDHPLGPYEPVGAVLAPRGRVFWDGLCTHNPTVHCFGGKYYLYYMGNTGDGRAMSSLNWLHRNNQRIGVAVADDPAGPWVRSDVPLLEPTPGFHDALCMANPSVARRPDGMYLMVYKAVSDKGALPFGGPVVHVAAISSAPTGPFQKSPDAIFTCDGQEFPAEDPYIWYGQDRFWAIVKDMNGAFSGLGTSLVLFQSLNGTDWTLAEHPVVSGLRLRRSDGHDMDLQRLERPQLLFNDNGQPIALFCAAADRADLNLSFNVHIPLSQAQLCAEIKSREPGT